MIIVVKLLWQNKQFFTVFWPLKVHTIHSSLLLGQTSHWFKFFVSFSLYKNWLTGTNTGTKLRSSSEHEEPVVQSDQGWMNQCLGKLKSTSVGVFTKVVKLENFTCGNIESTLENGCDSPQCLIRLRKTKPLENRLLTSSVIAHSFTDRKSVV